MDMTGDERPSDSPFVERVWRSQSTIASPFTSIASTHCELVVTRYQGKTMLTVRGPETIPTPAYCPPDAEFFGIQFKAGAFMPAFPAKMVMDRKDINLPEASSQSFYLNGSSWQYFDFENADTFVNRLVREGLLTIDPVVRSVLQGDPVEMSLRTVQRRFLQATGLTYGTMYQIKRARYATMLLKQGASILDAVQLAGYFDQPHLTRSLRQYIGQTPAQILAPNRVEGLSFLYKTDTFDSSYDVSIQQTRDVA